MARMNKICLKYMLIKKKKLIWIKIFKTWSKVRWGMQWSELYTIMYDGEWIVWFLKKYIEIQKKYIFMIKLKMVKSLSTKSN